MSSAGVGFSSAFCSQCGNRLEAGVKFCAGCGRPAGPAPNSPAGGVPPPIVALAQADDIAALEREVVEHPNDESYMKLLAVALHDDALKDWWEDPEDKSLLCVSKQGIDHAGRS
jgi:predicted amidophosphoribosyltransferase